MKKLAIGCASVLALVLVAGIALFYYVTYKTGSYLRDSGVLTSLESIGKGVKNETPFSPPGNGELTPEMMTRFAAVQESMGTKMRPRFNEIAAMQDQMMAREQAEHRKSTPQEDFKNVSAMMGFVVQAQGAWVEALNEQRFSMDEYMWARERVYTAAGVQAMQLKSNNLRDALSQGGDALKPISSAIDSVPPRNKELVAPYLPRMKDWAVLAFFGL